MILLAALLLSDLTPASYAWANRLTRESLVVMSPTQDASPPQYLLANAREAWEWIREKGGDEEQISPALAKLALEMGDYDAAIKDGAKSRSAEAARTIQEAGLRQRVAASAPAPVGFALRRAVPFKNGAWAVLAGKQTEGGSLFQLACDEVRLYVGRPGSWRSLPLEPQSSNEQTLIVRDLDGNGFEEVLLQEVNYGGSATPGDTTVFAHVGGTWKRIARESSHDPMELRSEGGKWVLRWVNAVADGMSHARMPRWMRARAWQGGTWTDVSANYAEDNRKMARYLRELMKEHPRNGGLADYLGRSAWRLGNRSEARRWWSTSADWYAATLRDPRWLEFADDESRSDLRRHISLLRDLARGRGSYEALDRSAF